MSRYVDMIGWDDVPHLKPPNIDPQELEELEIGMQPHQRQARRTGRPSLGAGAIYPVEEDSLLVEPFPIPEHFPRGWGMDVGWKVTAGLFAAYDPEAETYYLTGEYYGRQAQPVVHAHSLKRKMAWARQKGAIDPGSRTGSQRDGENLLEEYEDLGLNLEFANNAREAGITHVLTLMQTGQLKVFNTLGDWLREFRLYRRDEKGKIIKENDHLMDCMRYLLMTENIFVTQPIHNAEIARPRGEW